MAIYNSDVMAAQTEAQTKKLLPTELGGRVRLVHGEITPGAVDAGSVLALVRLPKGARLLPESRIHVEAGQSGSLTVKVGDSGNDARYLAAKNVGAAETTVMLDGNRLGNTVLKKEDVITLTTGGASFAAGKKIVFDLFYAVD